VVSPPSYPTVSDEKHQLNSALYDPEQTDYMSLSCFARPATRPKMANIPPQINPIALQKMGYNFKLVQKTKESRINEINEIESIA
jgi:hypothetical protein